MEPADINVQKICDHPEPDPVNKVAHSTTQDSPQAELKHPVLALPGPHEGEYDRYRGNGYDDKKDRLPLGLSVAEKAKGGPFVLDVDQIKKSWNHRKDIPGQKIGADQNLADLIRQDDPKSQGQGGKWQSVMFEMAHTNESGFRARCKVYMWLFFCFCLQNMHDPTAAGTNIRIVFILAQHWV